MKNKATKTESTKVTKRKTTRKKSVVKKLVEKKTVVKRKKNVPGFPVVGIGASAGGLDAFEQFFTHMPSDSGMAFVMVQHLDPTHKSILGDLVKRYTDMKVFQVENNMPIAPNCAYIIPPNRDMAILHGALHLMEPAAPRGLRLPIDYFFRSLAQDQQERAICIVLSGTGTDGTLGLKAVKGEGGLVMVQEPPTAKYDGMPRSAIGTGLVDYIMSADRLPQQLIEYVQHSTIHGGIRSAEALPKPADHLQKIFILVRAQTGHDFSLYKQNTIGRRIERRMVVNQIERISDYVRYLQQNPLEIDTLFKELLIGVTNFFRDTEPFVALEKVIPSLFKGRAPDQDVRVWVPGCSTGEEAYSIAMMIREHLDAKKIVYKVQVFATDIDNHAIETARQGIYPDSIISDVSTDRLQRFFTKQDNNTYQVNKTIRDMLVFALQDMIKDPPFSKLDLISCRNVLIYMGTELQKKLFPLFHYALSPGGYLFLGTSESVGEAIDYFKVKDRKSKLFQRKETDLHDRAPFEMPNPLPPLQTTELTRKALPREKASYREIIERYLLNECSPASLIINESCDVLYIHGRTGNYLEPSPGEASLNLLGMARQGLKLELTTAIRKAITQKKEVVVSNLKIEKNGPVRSLNLTVYPVPGNPVTRNILIVIFTEVPTSEPLEIEDVVDHQGEKQGEKKSSHALELERELRSTKEYLQTTIEELETSNEELKSTNEELQSSNEELQSTNEELETSKEELQSVNEELITVNSELEKKIEELSKTNNDMNNLMASTDIGTLFVDTNLNIQRFTPATTRVINLISTDIGRPLNHIVTKLNDPSLVRDVKRVLSTLEPHRREVVTEAGNWYAIRILPYRTLENVIDGTVITFVDITEQKAAQAQLQKLTAVVEQSPSLVVITDTAGDIEYVNPRFCQVTGYKEKEVLGKNPRLLRSREHSQDFYRTLWKAITAGEEWHGEFHNRKKGGELYWEAVAISPMINSEGKVTHYVALGEPIEQRKMTEEKLVKIHKEMEEKYKARIAELEALNRNLSRKAGKKKEK